MKSYALFSTFFLGTGMAGDEILLKNIPKILLLKFSIIYMRVLKKIPKKTLEVITSY
jgi:hypothetical protein